MAEKCPNISNNWRFNSSRLPWHKKWTHRSVKRIAFRHSFPHIHGHRWLTDESEHYSHFWVRCLSPSFFFSFSVVGISLLLSLPDWRICWFQHYTRSTMFLLKLNRCWKQWDTAMMFFFISFKLRGEQETSFHSSLAQGVQIDLLALFLLFWGDMFDIIPF